MVEAAAPAPMAGWTAQERSAAYRWLAGLFGREPTAEVLTAYASPQGRALLDHIGALGPLAPAATALAELAARDDPARQARDLASAYAWLFHGVGGRRSAPPYASVHTSARGLTHQEATSAARADLARLGMRLAPGVSEPPDHVAVQLSIMAELVDTAAPRAQAAFLDTRLLPWIGAFRDACAAGDRHGFYAGAAGAMAAFAAADREALGAEGRDRRRGEIPTGTQEPEPRRRHV